MSSSAAAGCRTQMSPLASSKCGGRTACGMSARSSLRGRSGASEPAELPAAAGGGGALQLVRAGGAGEAPFLPPLHPPAAQARLPPSPCILRRGPPQPLLSSATTTRWLRRALLPFRVGARRWSGCVRCRCGARATIDEGGPGVRRIRRKREASVFNVGLQEPVATPFPSFIFYRDFLKSPLRVVLVFCLLPPSRLSMLALARCMQGEVNLDRHCIEMHRK
jgi:hypothetical protein